MFPVVNWSELATQVNICDLFGIVRIVYMHAFMYTIHSGLHACSFRKSFLAVSATKFDTFMPRLLLLKKQFVYSVNF